ncbi:MAG: hypothetical protein H0W88_03540 [Parachlamydiaceae bacterium]|nr:hypothetical protein [Parachlamydiaceae bacterium]
MSIFENSSIKRYEHEIFALERQFLASNKIIEETNLKIKDFSVRTTQQATNEYMKDAPSDRKESILKRYEKFNQDLLSLLNEKLGVESALASALKNKLNFTKIQLSENRICDLKSEVFKFQRNPTWHKVAKVISSIIASILFVATVFVSFAVYNRYAKAAISTTVRNNFCILAGVWNFLPPKGVIYKATIASKEKLEKKIENEQEIIAKIKNDNLVSSKNI